LNQSRETEQIKGGGVGDCLTLNFSAGNEGLLFGWSGLDVPVQIFGEFVEDGIPINGIGIGETVLEICQGAGGGNDQGADGLDFFEGELAVKHVIRETVEEDTEEGGFLGECDAGGGIKKGVPFFGGNAALVEAVGDRVAVAFRSADESRVWSAAGRIGIVNSPGFTGLAFGGDGRAFGFGMGHCVVSF
jgi:hypothetical protein